MLSLLLVLLGWTATGAASGAPVAVHFVAEAMELPVVDPWEQARLAGVDFRAIGQEPGWLADIWDGQRIELLLDYGDTRITTPISSPETGPDGRTTVYRTDEVCYRGVACGIENPAAGRFPCFRTAHAHAGRGGAGPGGAGARPRPYDRGGAASCPRDPLRCAGLAGTARCRHHARSTVSRTSCRAGHRRHLPVHAQPDVSRHGGHPRSVGGVAGQPGRPAGRAGLRGLHQPFPDPP